MQRNTDTMDGQIERSTVDEVAEQTGVDVETVAAVLEAADSLGASCTVCGSEDRADYVTWYDLPFHGRRVLCWRHAAEAIEDVTILSELESQALALGLAGVPTSEMTIDKPSQYLRRARQKAEEAPLEIDRLEATQDLWEQYESTQT